MIPEIIEKIVDKYYSGWGGLISILEEIQAKYGYLPQEALKIVAEKMERPLIDIYGVVTFYRSFSLKPRGKHLVCVCMGTACHVRQAPIIASEFERQLGVAAGNTTADKEFALETVNCLGACALGPIVVVDGHYFSKVDTGKVRGMLKQARTGFDRREVKGDQRIFPVEVSCPRCNHSLMNPDHLIDGQPCIHLTTAFGLQHGWLRLSSLYGSYNIESEHDVPVDTVVNFFCPHCHAELATTMKCPDCSAPMVPMLVRGGGLVQICSRRGCKGHMLDLKVESV
ncbi:MAG: NAD(P)H-dependent oxidoreductase subunit E [Acidobacteriota bacterium]